MDDAFFSGKAQGKRGGGKVRKTKVLVCVEVQDNGTNRVTMKVVSAVSWTAVEHLAEGTHIRTDAYPS